MTVIWVNWTSFIRESGIPWGSETLKDTPFLNLMFPDGKGNVLIFLPLPSPTPCRPGIDCSCRANKGRLSAFTNQARFRTIVLFACCFISPGQTVQSVFLEHLLFITLVQSTGLVVNIQLDCVQKKIRSHPSFIGHWNTLPAFLF